MRHVFGSKVLAELSQKELPAHGIMQLEHCEYLCFHDLLDQIINLCSNVNFLRAVYYDNRNIVALLTICAAQL